MTLFQTNKMPPLYAFSNHPRNFFIFFYIFYYVSDTTCPLTHLKLKHVIIWACNINWGVKSCRLNWIGCKDLVIARRIWVNRANGRCTQEIMDWQINTETDATPSIYIYTAVNTITMIIYTMRKMSLYWAWLIRLSHTTLLDFPGQFFLAFSYLKRLYPF